MDSKTGSTCADSGACTCPPEDTVPEYTYIDNPPPYYAVTPPPPVEVMEVYPSPLFVAARDNRKFTPGKLLDNYRVIALLFTAICFLGGCWPALICAIPAFFFASAARDAKMRGNTAVNNNYERIACTLNCGALVACLAIVACLVTGLMRGSILS